MILKECPKCGVEFECRHDEDHCWCSDMPNIVPVPEDESQAGCLCPECLKKLIESKNNKSK